MTSPLEQYESDLARPDFYHDEAQAVAVACLQSLYQRLLVARNDQPGRLTRLARKVRSQRQPSVTGLYMWGGVGRGKTYLMDLFYHSLPFKKKLRIHFHHFMQRVHHQLTERQGEKNPLQQIAQQFAQQYKVICFDEFFVTDITDAMILGSIFEELFRCGVTLVATSNIVPDRLYENGLQRARFLPAIALLKQHTDVLNVDSETDYRLRTLTQAHVYHWPLSEHSAQLMADTFERLTLHAHGHQGGFISIESRQITTVAEEGDVIWFDFAALCDGPRSQNDYIEIASVYHTVLLSDVPRMGPQHDDVVRRFINLVDEFYDKNVCLVISAQVDIVDLYSGGKLEFEFQRTQSRLQEMQSEAYLSSNDRAQKIAAAKG